MKKFFRRGLAAAISAVILSGMAGCSFFNAKYEPVAGNVKADDRAVMTVNGEAITVSEYVNNYIFYKNYTEEIFANQGIDTQALWANELAAQGAASQIQKMARDQIIYERVLPGKLAEVGLELTEKDLDALKESKMGDDKGVSFQQWLGTIGTSEERYDALIRADKMLAKLKDYYFGDNGKLALPAEELRKTYDSQYYHVKHILIAEGDGALEKAQDIAARAKGGENFDALMKEFNTDSGEPAEGYTFTGGKMVQEFQNATAALKENEISDPVKTDYGYHIIQRLPLTEEGFEGVREEIVTTLSGTNFITMQQEWLDAADVKTEKLYDEITPDTLKDYLVETEAAPAK